MKQVSLNQGEIDIKKFKRIKRISKGGFGIVYQVEDKKTGKLYAAKVIDCNDDKEKCDVMIKREITIMINANHPTIIKFIGYSKLDFLGESNITIIMELAANGSLKNIIKKIQEHDGPKDYTNTSRQIILVGIARGMKYLHDRNIIHRDLKTDNILLDGDFHPMITDFGLSKSFEPGHSRSQTKFGGTLAYEAPEVLRQEKYDTKVDVYSFAILMFEVLTDSVPYPELESGEIPEYRFINRVVKKNYRPKFTVPVKKSFKKLIEKCWSEDPKDRPTFYEIFNKLSNKNSDAEEDKDEEDEDFLLDDVDIDELKLYVEDVNDATDLMEKLLNQVSQMENENKKLKNENKKQRVIIRKYEKEKMKIIDDFNQTKRELDKCKRESDQTKHQLDECKRKSDQTKHQLDECKRKSDQTKHQLDEYKRKSDQTKHQLDEYKRKSDQTKHQLDEYKRKSDQTKLELDEYKRKSDQTKLELDVCKRKSAHMIDENKTQKSMIEKYEKDNKKLMDELDQIKQELNECKIANKRNTLSIIVGGLDSCNELGVKPNNTDRDDWSIISPPVKVSFEHSSLLSYSFHSWNSVLVMSDGSLKGVGQNTYGRISATLQKTRIENFTEFYIKDSDGRNLTAISALCYYSGTLYLLSKNKGSGRYLVLCDYDINAGVPIFLNIGNHYPVSLFGGVSYLAAIGCKSEIIFISLFAVKQSIIKKSPNSPLPVLYLPNGAKPSSVSFCGESIFVLSSFGHVFTSQIENKKSIFKFSEVSELSGIEIVCLSGTSDHCLAVSNDGVVFGYGANYFGQLGLGRVTEKVSSFTFNESLRKYKISEAYAGYDHSLFKTQEGKILSCGSNQDGQLLTSNNLGENVYSPIETTITSGATFCYVGNKMSAVFIDRIQPPNTPNTRVQEGVFNEEEDYEHDFFYSSDS